MALVFTVKSEAFLFEDAPRCAGVYLLRTELHSFYIGQSVNIQRRMIEHGKGDLRFDPKTIKLFVFGQQACEQITGLVNNGARRAMECIAIEQLKPLFNQRKYSNIYAPERSFDIVWRKSTYIAEVYSKRHSSEYLPNFI